MPKYNQSPYVTQDANLSFAFLKEEQCCQAKRKIEVDYCDLKTKMIESKQPLIGGYKYVLFVENRRSMNFNLVLGSIVEKFGGVPRDSVRI